MVHKKLSPKEIEQLGELFFRDPLIAAINLMPHYFKGSCDPASHPRGISEDDSYAKLFIPSYGEKCEMPWVHRGVLAILLRDASWLHTYGETNKILRDFVAKDLHTKTIVPVFQLAPDGRMEFAIQFDRAQVMLPRGTAKTTLMKIAMVLLIAYQTVDYFVYVSAAAPHAEAQLADVKDIISNKPRFTEIFGDQRPPQRQGKRWSGDEFETESGVLVGARGVDGQIRGLSVKGRRPQLIILDDIEDEENVATKEQRNKLNRKYHSVIEPSLRAINIKGEYPAMITAINTLLSMASLNGDFLRSKFWLSIRFGAADSQGVFWFPLKMNKEQYERKKQTFIEAGQLATFLLEYDNKEAKDEEKFVIESLIKTKAVPEGVPLWNVLACDPAISEKENADEATIAVLGMEDYTGNLHVRVCDGQQGWHVDKYIDRIFELVEDYNIQLVGVESNAFQAVMLQLLQTEMQKRQRWFALVGLSHHKNKIARIKGWLRPHYINGTISHEQPMTKLTEQIIDLYDKNVKDDRVDVVAMGVELTAQYKHLLGPAEIDDNGDEIEELQARKIKVI